MSDPLLREIINKVEELAARTAAPRQPVKHNNRPKLTKRDVLVIRSMKRNGVSQKDIADAFDCNAATISRIVRGHYYR